MGMPPKRDATSKKQGAAGCYCQRTRTQQHRKNTTAEGGGQAERWINDKPQTAAPSQGLSGCECEVDQATGLAPHMQTHGEAMGQGDCSELLCAQRLFATGVTNTHHKHAPHAHTRRTSHTRLAMTEPRCRTEMCAIDSALRELSIGGRAVGQDHRS
jgi:hypothetical protein